MTARATSSPEASEDDGILTIGATPEEPKYDVLFRIGTTPCRGLINPSAGLMYEYLDKIRKTGANAALSWLLEEILDADAYQALKADRTAKPAESRKVHDLVLGLVFGNPDALPKSRRNT